MGEYDDIPYVVIERHTPGVGPFVFGALLGAAAALLLAPRSGEETQREIRSAARRLRGAAEGRVDEVRGSMTDAVDRTRGEIEGRIASVRDDLERRADRARRAVETGRDAARRARGELERRVEDAKTAYRAGVDATAGRREEPAAEVTVTEVVVEADAGDLTP